MDTLKSLYRPSLALLTDLYELTMAQGYGAPVGAKSMQRSTSRPGATPSATASPSPAASAGRTRCWTVSASTGRSSTTSRVSLIEQTLRPRSE